MKRDQQSECGICGCSEGLLLHNVRHRGSYRRLCSNCVLKSHQGLFCPFCLQVYDNSPPPPPQRLICSQCPSICHLTCSSSASASSFVCPPCSNPNFAFFDVNNKKLKVNGEAKTNTNVNDAGDDDKRSINVASARALVAAAKIAALSMSKAAAVARVEAERRVKEAALAKKRAKEALERLLYLASEEKERELKKGSGVLVKSNRPLIGAHVNNEKNGGEKNTNGLYSHPAPTPAPAPAPAAGKFRHQEGNHGMGK